MVAGFVLIAGVILILALAMFWFVAEGITKLLLCIVPMAPGLVMLGSLLLIFTELLLYLGNKNDRKATTRDIAYLLPTFIVSGALWYAAVKFLW